MEKEIKFITDEGYEYLVVFQEYTEFSKNFNIPIVDVSIILMNSNIEQNTFKSLNQFIKIIKDYLGQNKELILYYYCDSAPIKIRTTRKIIISPQEFRNNLFSAMFNQYNPKNFIIRNFIAHDPDYGNHYTSLISNKSQIEKLDLVIKELETLFKK